MTVNELPEKDTLIGEEVLGYKLLREIGRGKMGVVYLGEKLDIKSQAAIKIIPSANLRPTWEKEVEKAELLQGRPEFVAYKTHRQETIRGQTFGAIAWEFVNGLTLRQYVLDHPDRVTPEFIRSFLATLIAGFKALETKKISHGDLHAGNILVAHDQRSLRPDIPTFKISDFGIGRSSAKGGLQPKDDYRQLAIIVRELSQKINRSILGMDGKRLLDFIVTDFVPKGILESNLTLGARDSLALHTKLTSWKPSPIDTTSPTQLTQPFDYLSCEQIEESSQLLQRLYSEKFPGYSDLIRLSHTLIVGPRGAGRTTILRNLGSRLSLLAGKKIDKDRLCLYYPCIDLYFAFPYLKQGISSHTRQCIATFFQISILHELCRTLSAIRNFNPELITMDEAREFERFVLHFFPMQAPAPTGADIFAHLESWLEDARRIIRANATRQNTNIPALGLDFFVKTAQVVQEIFELFKKKPLLILLDDYSLPNISIPIQESLHDFIFARNPYCFFKVSTESIASFHPLSSNGKLLEPPGDYDVLDLGSLFLNASPDTRSTFLASVVNGRLTNCAGIHQSYQDIKVLLGPNAFPDYNSMAEHLLKKRRTQPIYYGWELFRDLCSGDIRDLLIELHGIFLSLGNIERFGTPGIPIPFEKRLQDEAIKKRGRDFVERLSQVPGTGTKMAEITQHFGRYLRWVLETQRSKNEKFNPPKQAFRIELQEPLPSLNDPLFIKAVKNTTDRFRGIQANPEDVRTCYRDLLRYGVFLRDLRGKSQRGYMVDRLYLRRLLLPQFRVTPSERDNVRLEVHEFILLLLDPKRFYKEMTSAKRLKQKEREAREENTWLLPLK